MLGSHPHLAMPKVQLFCVLFGFRPSFGRHRFFYVVLLLLLVERVVVVASVTHFLDATCCGGATPQHGQWWLGVEHAQYLFLARLSMYSQLNITLLYALSLPHRGLALRYEQLKTHT